MSQTASYELEIRVVKGLHVGARLSLKDHEVLVIGSAEHCDILLLDEGVEPEHLKWVKREGRWHSQSDDMPVSLDKSIDVGSAAVMLCRSDQTQPASFEKASVHLPTKRKRMRLLVALLVLLVAWGAAGVGIAYHFKKADVKAAPMLRLDDSTSQDGDVQALLKYLERQLKERGLANYVQVKKSQRGISLEGELSEREIESLERLKASAYERFGTNVDVETFITPMLSGLPFEISAVVYSHASHVMLSNDRQLFEGESMMGYRLITIRPGHMIWEGSRRLDLPW